MLVKKTSVLTGKTHVMSLPVNNYQLELWENGALIQNVMPKLSSTQREFLITGMSEEEQDRFFVEEEA